MSKLLYGVMYKENAKFTGANYVQDKVVLVGLVEEQVAAFEGLVNRVDALGFNPTNDAELDGLSTAELSAIVTQLAHATPNETLGVFSKAQGDWVYTNHPDFEQVTE